MKAGIQALGHEPDELEIIIGSSSMLLRDGEQVRLSKRKGDIIVLPTTSSTRSVPTPPASPTCCSRSTRSRPSTSSCHRQQSMENPVFYVQMAHARLAGIARGRRRRASTGSRSSAVDLSAC